VTNEHDTARILLGAYVLGGLDDTDRYTVEAHLPVCRECRDELVVYAPMPGLMRRVPDTTITRAGADRPGPISPPPATDGLGSLLDRLRRARRARRRSMARWSAAAVAVLVLVAVLGTEIVARSGDHPPIVRFVAATGSRTTGQATLTDRPWGTAVSLNLRNVTAPGPFRLMVSGTEGRTEQAASWGRTATARAEVTGASAIRLRDIGKLSVLDRDGRVLATAPSP